MHPTTFSNLTDGIILSTLANGIMTAESEAVASTQSWNCVDFVVNRMDGRYGAVSFFGADHATEKVVGLFLDAHSPRNPMRDRPRSEFTRVLDVLPIAFRDVATERTQRFNNLWYQGEYVPIAIAAIWGSKDGEICTSHPWDQMMEDGLSVIENELKGKNGIQGFIDEYEMSASKTQLFSTIAVRLLADPNTQLRLSAAQREIVVSNAESTDAIDRCRRILQHVNVMF